MHVPASSLFGGEYQGGSYVEVLSTQGQDPLTAWKLSGNRNGVQKLYDKEIRTWIVLSSAGNRMQLPKDDNERCGLTQTYLVLQVELTQGQSFAVELGICDASNSRRRLLLSTNQTEVKSTALHCQVPLATVLKDVWLNLTIPMAELTSSLFTGAMFKCLDSISLSGTFKLRKIFTLMDPPSDTVQEQMLHGLHPNSRPLPRQVDFSPDIDHHTQVFDYRMVAPGSRRATIPPTISLGIEGTAAGRVRLSGGPATSPKAARLQVESDNDSSDATPTSRSPGVSPWAQSRPLPPNVLHPGTDHPPPSRLGRNSSTIGRYDSGTWAVESIPTSPGARIAPSTGASSANPDAALAFGRRAISAQTISRVAPGHSRMGPPSPPNGPAPSSPPWPASLLSHRAQSGPAGISTELLSQGLGDTSVPIEQCLSPSLARYGRRAGSVRMPIPTIAENAPSSPSSTSSTSCTSPGATAFSITMAAYATAPGYDPLTSLANRSPGRTRAPLLPSHSMKTSLSASSLLQLGTESTAAAAGSIQPATAAAAVGASRSTSLNTPSDLESLLQVKASMDLSGDLSSHSAPPSILSPTRQHPNLLHRYSTEHITEESDEGSDGDSRALSPNSRQAQQAARKVHKDSKRKDELQAGESETKPRHHQRRSRHSPQQPEFPQKSVSPQTSLFPSLASPSLAARTVGILPQDLAAPGQSEHQAALESEPSLALQVERSPASVPVIGSPPQVSTAILAKASSANARLEPTGESATVLPTEGRKVATAAASTNKGCSSADSGKATASSHAATPTRPTGNRHASTAAAAEPASHATSTALQPPKSPSQPHVSASARQQVAGRPGDASAMPAAQAAQQATRPQRKVVQLPQPPGLLKGAGQQPSTTAQGQGARDAVPETSPISMVAKARNKHPTALDTAGQPEQQSPSQARKTTTPPKAAPANSKQLAAAPTSKGSSVKKQIAQSPSKPSLPLPARSNTPPIPDGHGQVHTTAAPQSKLSPPQPTLSKPPTTGARQRTPQSRQESPARQPPPAGRQRPSPSPPSRGLVSGLTAVAKADLRATTASAVSVEDSLPTDAYPLFPALMESHDMLSSKILKDSKAESDLIDATADDDVDSESASPTKASQKTSDKAAKPPCAGITKVPGSTAVKTLPGSPVLDSPLARFHQRSPFDGDGESHIPSPIIRRGEASRLQPAAAPQSRDADDDDQVLQGEPTQDFSPPPSNHVSPRNPLTCDGAATPRTSQLYTTPKALLDAVVSEEALLETPSPHVPLKDMMDLGMDLSVDLQRALTPQILGATHLPAGLNDSKQEGSQILPVAGRGTVKKHGEAMIEVVFDPILNCYYEPHSNQYYELVR